MAYKKNKEKLPYSENIASKLREMAPTSTIREMFSRIQSYQNAPASMTTFYSKYQHVWEEAKGDLVQKVGDLVFDNALRTDEEAVDNPYVQKDRHFILERRGGWNKTDKVETREVEGEFEENTSAVSALMAALGKDTPSEETED